MKKYLHIYVFQSRQACFRTLGVKYLKNKSKKYIKLIIYNSNISESRLSKNITVFDFSKLFGLLKLGKLQNKYNHL